MKEPLTQEIKDWFEEKTGYRIIDSYGYLIEKDGRKWEGCKSLYDEIIATADGRKVLSIQMNENTTLKYYEHLDF